jgi:hypothetical protein
LKVLFTGTGEFGSWTMRAEQLAATRREWKAVPHATGRDAAGMDAVVIVKHIRDPSLSALKAWGGPLVYDALDFWPQGGSRKRPRKIPRLRDIRDAQAMALPYLKRIDPDLVICPTRAMAEDLAPLGWDTRVLYHHYDPRIEIVPVPAKARRTVVYHGQRDNLGWWLAAAHASCLIHGARFVVSNGPQPAPGHVLLGVRRTEPWIARRWKSNVKAAFALRLGLPFVAWPEAGYRETHPGAFWFTTATGMHRAIGEALEAPLSEPDDRFSVEACASELERILRDLPARLAGRQPAPAADGA